MEKKLLKIIKVQRRKLLLSIRTCNIWKM